MPADVGVRWRAPFDGGRAITRYEVDGGEGNSGVTKQSLSAATLQATFTNVPDGLHFFRVRAQNSIGWGPWSDGSLIKVNIGDLVALNRNFSGTDRISIFDIDNPSNTSNYAPIRDVNIPSGRFINGLTFIGGSEVAMVSRTGFLVSIFSIADTTPAERTILLPTGRTNPQAITYIGNNQVAVLDATDRLLSIFSIVGADGSRASEIKTIRLPRQNTPIESDGLTYIGNGQVAWVSGQARILSVFSIEGASGTQATEVKYFNLEAPRVGSISGITYIGINQVVIVAHDQFYVASIDGASGSDITAIRSYAASTNIFSKGIAFLSNIHGF